MAQVYVSSTRTDLGEHRRLVIEVLTRMGHTHVAMEHYVAEGRPPIEKCLEDVAACDIYVGIVAFRYGSVPPGYDRSFTELEFDRAVETGKKPLVFVLAESAPEWPPMLFEFGAIQRVLDFRRKVADAGIVEFFSTKDELRAQLGDRKSVV